MSAKPAKRNRSSKFRPDDDFFATPEEGIFPFVRSGLLPEGAKIWECACGEGHISKSLEYFGFDVVSTNLTDRGYGETGVDFLKSEELRAPHIMSNPPFRLLNEFLTHMLFLNPLTASFFVPLKFLASEKRYSGVFTKRPPAFVCVFVDRIKFYGGDTPEAEQPGFNTEDFAWAHWRSDHVGDPRIRWLRRDDGRQGSFDELFAGDPAE